MYRNMAAPLNFVIMCYLLSIGHGLPIATMKTIETATKVLEFAVSVNDVIGIITSDSSDNGQLNQDELLASLKAHIEGTRIEILSSMILWSKLNSIDEAVKAVRSSLEDVEHVLEAETGASELLGLFVSRYEEHDVIKHVRFLSTLLTYRSPTDNVDLITLVREGTRCGAAEFNEFRDYYLNLLVDGALLDIVYLQVKARTVNIDTVITRWAQTILDADTIFAAQIPICNNRFPSDVLTDLQINNDHSVLKTTLSTRYPDRNFDMIFYSGIGTHQFHGFRYTTKHQNFFWDQDLDTRNKVLVTIDNNGKPNWNKASTKSKLESCVEGVAVDNEDERAADNVLTTLSLCEGLTYPIGTAIVYFESDDFPTEVVTKYSDSPVVELSIEPVTLKYCFKTGFMCTFSSDESTGRYRIFVYPNFHDDIQESDYVFAGSWGIRAQIWHCVVTVLVYILRNVF